MQRRERGKSFPKATHGRPRKSKARHPAPTWARNLSALCRPTTTTRGICTPCPTFPMDKPVFFEKMKGFGSEGRDPPICQRLQCRSATARITASTQGGSPNPRSWPWSSAIPCLAAAAPGEKSKNKSTGDEQTTSVNTLLLFSELGGMSTCIQLNSISRGKYNGALKMMSKPAFGSSRGYLP